MIPVVTTDEMQNIDKSAINGDLEIGYKYMHRAAEGLFDVVKQILPQKQNDDFSLQKEVAIICGKGNNGGDGFLLAKLLNEKSPYKVKCFALCGQSDLQGEAKLASEDLSKSGLETCYLDAKEGLENFSSYLAKKSDDLLVVDAMLGTGSKGEPRGLYGDLIKLLNETKLNKQQVAAREAKQSSLKLLSVDVPSGDLRSGSCLKADVTVTMGFPKLNTFFYPERSSFGTLVIKDLGYPQDIVSKNESGIYFPTYEDLKRNFPRRKADGSKFDHGVAFMLSGSKGMTGAAYLSSMSAMRSGLGMVHLSSAESAIKNLSEKLTEVVLHPLAETKEGNVSSKALKPCLEMLSSSKFSVACIGPGLSHHEESSSLVRDLVRDINIPVLLDADGINAFKDNLNDLKKHKSPILITPHEGEFARLFSEVYGSLPKEPVEKIQLLKKIAREYNISILLKGVPTIVVDPAINESRAKAYILPFGNSGMATAGSGDVLSGIITGMAAQGLNLNAAAIIGTYLHGEAGNRASQRLTEYSMIASDILDELPQAIKTLI